MTVRTRIAPSPTGDPHVGTAYVALFNYCFAKQHQGEFILRIEDTDQQRSTDSAEAMIIDSLRWLGLAWSEGPDIGGPFGPYRQSERREIYQQYAQQLLAQGHAFKCYRTASELAAIRQKRREQGNFTALKEEDLALEAVEYARREQAQAPYVIRLKVPTAGTCIINDLLRGPIELDWEQVDAQILLKSDGMPTYHLANVVDDHLMEITHVLRGEEWLNSAPKHLLLYQYFDWQMPALCHLPLLRNPDKSKLSKRKNPTSINYYRKMGFLPQALLNYLGRMGWSMPNGEEKFNLAEMITHFDLQRISLGGPIFDQEKLRWLNGRYLREDFTDQQLIKLMQQWAFNISYIEQIVPQLRSRIELLADVMPLALPFFSGLVNPAASEFAKIGLSTEQQAEILQLLIWQFEQLDQWHKSSITEACQKIGQFYQLKLKQVLAPVFIAITASSASVSVLDVMAIIGSDLTRARLQQALVILGGLSKKQLKILTETFSQLNP